VSVTEPKKASINISQALVHISLTTIAAIGSAMGIPWVAGATALPAAIIASETLQTFLTLDV
jgi:hypothetical protein